MSQKSLDAVASLAPTPVSQSVGQSHREKHLFWEWTMSLIQDFPHDVLMTMMIYISI